MREDCVRASPFFVERNQLHRIIFAVRFTSCTCTQLLVLRFGIAYSPLSHTCKGWESLQ